MKKILILNDLHIGKSRESSRHPGHIRQANNEALARFEEYIPKFNNDSFDLVFNLGDIIRDLDDRQADLRLLDTALLAYTKLDAPKIYIPGNHEFKSLSHEDITKSMLRVGLDQPLKGLYELGDHQILWLDSDIGEKDIARVSDTTMSWLDTTLRSGSRPIIFSHYSLVPLDGQDNFYFSNGSQYMSYTNHDEILKILERCQSVLTINAHVHMGTFKKINNVTAISSMAFSENFYASAHPDANPGIYSILTLHDDNTYSFRSYSGDFCFLSFEI